MSTNKLDRFKIAIAALEKAKIIETQDDVVTKMGYKRANTVSDILNGRANLSTKFVRLFCLTFNINERWLLTGEGEMNTTASDKTKLFAKSIESSYSDHKDSAGLKTYLKDDKIERLESKWKSLLAGLMLGKQETKTMQELDDIIQDLKADNDRLEDEQNGRNNEADTK